MSRVDEQLRAEMVEAQAQLARWITEQKQIADTVTLQAQNTLDTDKGEPPARVREREREGESGGERQSHTTEGSLFPPPLRGRQRETERQSHTSECSLSLSLLPP